MDYKILIVDDHGLVRSGLKPILDDALNCKCQVLEAETYNPNNAAGVQPACM